MSRTARLFTVERPCARCKTTLAAWTYGCRCGPCEAEHRMANGYGAREADPLNALLRDWTPLQNSDTCEQVPMVCNTWVIDDPHYRVTEKGKAMLGRKAA